MNWGESFLKSGLPFEHLTLLTLDALGWDVMPHFEFRRADLEPGQAGEIDLLARPPGRGQAGIRLLIECKYHDPSRYWMLLPSSTDAHLSESDSRAAGEEVERDSFFLKLRSLRPVAKPLRADAVRSRAAVNLGNGPREKWSPTSKPTSESTAPGRERSGALHAPPPPQLSPTITPAL